jgi:acyl dehydratase
MLTVATPADLLDHVGDALAPTGWVEIDQARIDLFADATGDHQWIHVDPERAAAGPFGAPIAHGFLTLSLANLFLPQLLVVETFSMGVNVGLDKVRFPAPVRVGSRIRGRGEIVSAAEAGEGVQVVVRITVEVDGNDKPACVADTVSRFFP